MNGPGSRRRIVFEIIIVVAFAALSKLLLNSWTWKFSGPISLVVTWSLLTVYLRFRGERWSDFGLCRLEAARARWLLLPQTLLVGAAFAVAVAISVGGGRLLGLEFMQVEPAGVEQRWGSIEGNILEYLLWMFLAWTTAAFGEEMLFRGYLISRLRNVLGTGRGSNIVVVVISAAIFGFAHFYYQGLRGLVVTTAIGIAFGTVYLVLRRNLWPLILWHGLFDSLTFTAHFKNWDI